VHAASDACHAHARGNAVEARIDRGKEARFLRALDIHHCHLCTGVDKGLDWHVVQFALHVQHRHADKGLRVDFNRHCQLLVAHALPGLSRAVRVSHWGSG
jgi:hypothetical protein